MRPYTGLLAALLGAACAGTPAKPAGSYLQAAGTGRPDPASQTETQRKATSRDAAIADARNRLRLQLEQLPASKGKTSDIERLIFSAEPVSTRWEADTATVVLRLDKKRIDQALESDAR